MSTEMLSYTQLDERLGCSPELTAEQRAELEEQGPQNIRFKLASYGGGRRAAIGGFRCGDITRSEIEDWLAEKYQMEAAQQRSILRWARIAGWAGIVSVILAGVGIWLSWGR